MSMVTAGCFGQVAGLVDCMVGFGEGSAALAGSKLINIITLLMCSL
jgi:hypothetical protein